MTHSPSVTVLKSSGALIFRHPCWVCGGPAHIGTGVNLKKYVIERERGGQPDIKLLGRWRCFGCEDA